MNRLLGTLFLFLLAFFAAPVDLFAQPTEDVVLRLFAAAWSDASDSEFSDILARRIADADASLYLLLRTCLAEGQWDKAKAAADGFLTAHSGNGYLARVHFGRAQALYGLGNLSGAKDELMWVERNAKDSRLRARCREIQLELKKHTSSDKLVPSRLSEARSVSEKFTVGARTVLLTVFPEADDPAARNLQAAFLFAVSLIDPSLNLSIVQATTPLEAHEVATDAMRNDSVTLVVFAGDEGSAVAVTQLSEKYQCPLLKLTADVRSMTSISSQIVEFLPSAETQSLVLGEFAAHDLRLSSLMILAPQDAVGRSTAQGFEVGAQNQGATVDTVVWYPAAATGIRREITAVFANQTRLQRGENPLASALSADERTEVFGDHERGEVLTSSPLDAQKVEKNSSREGLFAVLLRDHLNDYAGQLRAKPKATVLLGNSGWYHEEILAHHSEITDGMYFTLPLLPQVDETTEPLASFLASAGIEADEWVLLGLDAGTFVGHIIQEGPQNRLEMLKLLNDSREFAGVAVHTDFAGTRENHGARVLCYRKGEVQVEK